MKKTYFVSYLMPLALLGLGLTGCSQTGPIDTADEEAEASEQALPQEGGREGARAGHRSKRGGPEHVFRGVLDGITLTADQTKTIDAAFANARPDENGRADHEAFFAELAKGVRAGKIDGPALDAKLAELDKNKPDMRARMASTLQTVHDTLTAAQRKELVANVEAKVEGRMDQGFHKDGDRPKGDHEKRDHKKGGKGPLGKMLKGLELTEDQKAAIETAFAGSGKEKPEPEAMKAKHEEMRAKMKAMLDAFPSDDFDAKALLPDGPKGRGPREHLSRMVAALEVVAPILNDAQRAELADRIESGDAMKKHGPPKGAAGPDTEE